MILNFRGNNLKTVNYKNPIVVSYLFIVGIFFITGFYNGFFFFLLGLVFIVLGLQENNKLS